MVPLISLLIIILILIIFFKAERSSNESFFSSKLNIIQTWKSSQLPPQYQKLVTTLKKKNPDCNYLFFNDQDIDTFIKNYFPQYWTIFQNFPYTIQKIDFFRYLAIYHYGGVYLDLDFEVYKSLHNLNNLSKCVFPLEFIRNSDTLLQKQGFQGLIGNYAFYAPKNHPFIKKIIDNIVSQRISIKLSECSDFRQFVYYTTGPVMVTQSYIDYSQKKNINIIQPYPFKKSSFGDYGHHVQSGTWK